jgi:hypothetical protein
MSTTFKTLLSLAAVAAFFVSAAAMADFRDYNYKGWNSIYLREHTAAARSNRSVAPMVARSQSAPVEVAQAPTTERANSYEPATKTDAGKPAPKTATRSFSYEPAASAPVFRGGRANGDNSYERAMRAKGY